MTPNPNPQPEAACILLVEDEVLVRAALAEDLRELGFSVLEATSADEALPFFNAGMRVDLVFTDIQLPGSLDGLQMARRLRDEHPDLPVVLTSGNTGLLGGKGMELFIPKPYQVPEVIAFIAELLRRLDAAMSEPCILIVEGDGLIRAPLAQYLRECGYRVLEAVNGDEARQLLASDEWRIDVVLAGAHSPAGTGFSLAAWTRRSYPGVAVILAGGVARAAEKAGDLCQEGPKLSKPYDHRLVLDRIRRLLATRDRRRAGKGK